MLSRRSLLGSAALAATVPAGPAAAAPPTFLDAIARAAAADSAYRASGLLSARMMDPAGRLSPTWRAHRLALLSERRAARSALYALTPATQDEARALVAYYASRAKVATDPTALRVLRRRVLKVLARAGAASPGCELPAVLVAHNAPS